MSTHYPSIDRQAEYWDWWEDTRSTNSWSIKRANVILRLIKSLNLTNSKIVDLGCGTGWFANELMRFGEITAIDLSERHIKEAKIKNPAVNFISGDLFTFPLKKNYFDLVVSQQVIAHVPDQGLYIKKILELLKPNGWLVISSNNKFVMDRLGDKYHDHKEMGHIENWLTARELKSLLQNHFKILFKCSVLPRGSRGILRIIN